MGSGERLTDRLRLEPVGPQSADALVALHEDPGIAVWYAGPWSRQQAVSWGEAMAAQWAGEGVGKWLAYQRTDGSLVGRGGLSVVSLFGQRRLEVGWAVRQELWGRGFASEIGRAALKLAFQDWGRRRS